MVGGGESMAIAFASIWASMATWFTPTLLFCLMNLIVATIFIASNKNHKHHNHHQEHDRHHDHYQEHDRHHDHYQEHDRHHDHVHVHGDSSSRVARVSSLLERAGPMSISSSTTTTTAESEHRYPSQSETASYGSSSRLAQSIHSSSSNGTLPELLKGDDLSESESERHPPSQPTRAPSLLERVRSINFSSVYSANTFPTEPEQIANSAGQLVRAPSLLDRVRSFKIPSPFKSGAPSTQPEKDHTDPRHNPDHHVIKSKSEKTDVTSANKSLFEMKKSRSEIRISSDDEEDVDRRRPATARERRNTEDQGVDAKADDFISRFKQQLNLQRLDSLVRYKELLNRRSYYN